MPEKLIICIKWGKKYGPHYVNRLYGMLSRQVTPPFSLHCFTDDRTGIREEVVCHDLPDLGCAHPKNVPGKWTKTVLWGHSLDGLSGPALFIDLDSVIVDNIDDFFSYGAAEDVILARNWLKPHRKLGQTTLFRYCIGHQPYMLENFQANPQGIADKYRFEQHYVTRNIKEGIKFWPKEWVRHYRVHCLGNNYIMRYFRPARLPKGVKIVAFPGHPQPEDALLGKWTGDRTTVVTPRQHIKNAFSKNTRIKKGFFWHLRSFQLPCPWIKEHWRE